MHALDRLRVTVLAEDSVGYETPYLGQHGISLLLDAARGATTRRVLIDVAQHPDPLLFNMERMGIEPASIDTIVLTHCHYDHTRGLARILETIGKDDVPVVAHPDVFRLTFITDPYLRHIGVPASDSREHIEAAGGRLFLARTPLALMPGLTTSGEIERTTDFEAPEMELRTIREQRVEVDEVADDISVFAVTRESGTVVLTGCSHAGIVNITRAARAMSGGGVGAVVGGLHLVEASAERITKTAAALNEEGVSRVFAGHCTGFPAQVELGGVFGDRFAPLRTGDVLEF